MGKKIRLHLFGVALLSVLLTAIVTGLLFSVALDRQARENLRQAAHMAAENADWQADPAALAGFASDGLRLTLIDADGTVLYDSKVDAATMENHAERDEVREALSAGSGEAMRHSASLGQDVYYYALRLPNGQVLRASTQTDGTQRAILHTALLTGGLLVLLLALCLLLSALLTKKLLRPVRDLAGQLADSEATPEAVYPELEPFVQQIVQQRQRISKQMRTIAAERDRLSAVIENMAEGLLVLDRRQRVLIANRSAQALLQCPAIPEGENIFACGIPQDAAQAVCRAYAGENAVTSLALGGRQLQLLSNPVVSGDARIGVICSILDVTDKLQMEKMRREFTANVSHELKTPLTSISGYAEMIETGLAQPEDVAQFASRIRKEAARLLVLIGDILRLSELDETDRIFTMEPVELRALADECIGRLALTAEKRGVTLHVEGGPHVVQGNRAMLSELLYNLCDNAIRYNREGGEVFVTVSDRRLCVRDTGLGIPQKHQTRVFERFYRVDKSRSKETGGTGLGLAIVKHIAERHNAAITLRSEEGIGTEITVQFAS